MCFSNFHGALLHDSASMITAIATLWSFVPWFGRGNLPLKVDAAAVPPRTSVSPAFTTYTAPGVTFVTLKWIVAFVNFWLFGRPLSFGVGQLVEDCAPV